MSVASGFFLGAMSPVSDGFYHVADLALSELDRPTRDPFIINYSNPKIDGETTYGN